MKWFNCQCGNRVFFENTQCLRCQRVLGFDPDSGLILGLDQAEDGLLHHPTGTFRYCQNRHDYDVCNWLVPAHDGNAYCRACRLNQTIPSLTKPENRTWWAHMEHAKRRLLYTLLQLGLPITSKREDPQQGLAFAFLEDQQRNPDVADQVVMTGHANGLITLNLAEADDVSRELARENLGESYRTLLGHFRHESGHYYFDRLVRHSPLIEPFRELFGDEQQDYQTALKAYYRNANPADTGWTGHYISAYAQSHPLEDWAECWAHYLHMVDTLETAAWFDLGQFDLDNAAIEQWLEDWRGLTLALNEMNRSIGLRAAYPFVLSPTVLNKLRFVHQVAHPSLRPKTTAATV